MGIKSSRIKPGRAGKKAQENTQNALNTQNIHKNQNPRNSQNQPNYHELNIPVQIPHSQNPHKSKSGPIEKSKSILAAENAVLDQVNKLTENNNLNALKKRSSVDDVSKALANLRNETLQQLSASELKETRLDVINAKLKHELKLLSSECQRLVAERDTAVDEMMSILQRNQNLEQDRNRIRHQFNLYRQTKSQEVKRLSEEANKAKSTASSKEDLREVDDSSGEKVENLAGKSENKSGKITQNAHIVRSKPKTQKTMPNLDLHNADFHPQFPEKVLRFPIEKAIGTIFKLPENFQDIELKLKTVKGAQHLQLPENPPQDEKVKLSFRLFCAVHQIKIAAEQTDRDSPVFSSPPKSYYIVGLMTRGKLHLANSVIRRTIERVEVGENPNYDETVDSLFGLGALCSFCLRNSDKCFNDLEEINDAQMRADLVRLFRNE